MGKVIKDTIHANGIDIGIYTEDFENEFILLTDIARYKSDDPTAVIQNWMRNRNIIEFLGLWERLHNSNFKHLEFEGGVESRKEQMHLQCQPKSGWNLRMLLALFQKQDDMAEHMRIVILRWLLQLGFHLNSSMRDIATLN